MTNGSLSGLRLPGRDLQHSRGCPMAGTTLIELMFALLLLAIILGMAMPTVSGFLQRQQLKSAYHQLISALAYTRSEAIRRGIPVTLLRSGSDWSSGWVVFVDANDSISVDGAETILRRGEPVSDNLQITGNSMVAQYVRYTASGQTQMYSGSFQVGTLTACHSAPDIGGAALIISISGRVRLEGADCES